MAGKLDIFKDACNRYRTISLFIEHTNEDAVRYPPIFTLAEEDREVGGVTYISAKRKYLEYADPTEYTFATKVFGTFECWESVCNSPVIRPHIEQWRKELDLLLKARAVTLMQAKAEKGDTNAIRWLAETRWKTGKKGRPKKEREEQEHSEDHRAAAHRLGITVVQ